MTRFNDAPIRTKLTISILLTSGVVMLIMCGAFFTYDYVTLRRTTLRQASTLGDLIALNSTAALAFDDREEAAAILNALDSERLIVAACLFGKDGRTFARYPKGLAEGSFPSGPRADGYRFERAGLEGFQPVVQRGKRLGTLYLKFDTSTIIDAWTRDFIAVAAAVTAFVFLVAYILSRALERRISRPILVLAEAAKAVSVRQDYSVRAVKHGQDELGLLTDAFNQMLTQIQKLNQNLEQRVAERTAQLEAANRELEAFSYSVSHDLRAPLRHIHGFTGMLRSHSAASLDEEGNRYLVTISDAAKRMGQLIDDLLAFSRVGRSHLELVEIDHDALVAAVIREGRYDSNQPAIEWSIGPLPRVRADPALLKQVWANLISNAVKYSAKSPHPRIEIASVPSSVEIREQVFSIRDNGVGFDMAYAHKLFGVFQRLHDAAEFEGTGIGLAHVRRIVSRHAGRTWAESRVGEGATFYFSLPLDPPRKA